MLSAQEFSVIICRLIKPEYPILWRNSDAAKRHEEARRGTKRREEVGGRLPGVEYVLTVAATDTSKALLLRPWAERDIPALVAAHQDPEMRRWLRNSVIDEAAARRLIATRQAELLAGTGVSFAVFLTDGEAGPGEVVGGVSLRGLGGATGKGVVGYWVAAPARGRGVASRAVNAVCEWAFELQRTPRVRQLELIHAIGNGASCRVAEKTGFALSAVLPALPPEYPSEGHLHTRAAYPLP